MISKIDRKRIYIFVAIAYAISIVLALVLFFSGGLYLRPWVANPLWQILGNLLMLAPAIANIATRLITREGWSNTLLRPNFRRGWPYYLAAWFLPALATLAGGAIYYLLYLGRFDSSMTWARDNLGLNPIATGPGIFPIIVRTAYVVLLSPLAIPLMIGEEFGWRAYLQPKLMPLGPRKAVLLVGTIWAVWHWPFIFMGFEYGLNYWGAPVVGSLLFIWFCVLASIFLGWLTLRSSSVWPAALGHGVINAAALLMIAYISGEPNLLVGPGHVGIIGSLGYVTLALPIFFIPGALAPTADRNQGAELLKNPPGATA